MMLRGIRKIVSLLLCLAMLGSLPAHGFVSTPEISDPDVLAQCYVRYLVTEQVGTQAGMVADTAAEADREQIREAVETWKAEQMTAIRGDLAERFGDESKTRFQSFVSAYTDAEQRGDPEFLANLARWLEIDTPASYVELKKFILTTRLSDDMSTASDWMSELQTWVDLRRRVPDTPPLAIWMTRNEEGPAPVAATTMQSRPTNPLMEAEPDFVEFVEEDDEEYSPLDSFDSMRSARREKALEEAHEGMRQVAEEREAAEEEYAQKQLAAAQAEADAMKRQAEKLASVEQEALEQRKKSWGNRLKSIVGATLSAGIGAFTGGVGTRAGEEAANAIFND